MTYYAKTIDSVSFLDETKAFEHLNYVVYELSKNCGHRDYLCFDYQFVKVKCHTLYLYLRSDIGSESGSYPEEYVTTLVEIPRYKKESTSEFLSKYVESFVYGSCDWFDNNSDVGADFNMAGKASVELCNHILRDYPTGLDTDWDCDYKEVRIEAETIEEAITAFLNRKDNYYTLYGDPDAPRLIVYPSGKTEWAIWLEY